jgi:phage-related protein
MSNSISLKDFIRAKKRYKLQQETLRRVAEEEKSRSSKWHLTEKESEDTSIDSTWWLSYMRQVRTSRPQGCTIQIISESNRATPRGTYIWNWVNTLHIKLHCFVKKRNQTKVGSITVVRKARKKSGRQKNQQTWWMSTLFQAPVHIDNQTHT